MRWPWERKSSQDQFIVSWSAGTLAFVRARTEPGGLFSILQAGVERQGSDSLEMFVQRLQALGLRGLQAKFMLWPEQYQFLQIDAPAVAPEELRAAARYQVKDMVQSHIDDVTLDVMRVGDDRQKSPGFLFVVAATNAVVREMLDLGDSLEWGVSVIDIQETAQRNLQNAMAARNGGGERAQAALVLVEGHQAVLTISANDELFYTRRLELPEGFLSGSWGQGAQIAPVASDAYAPVEEYVPSYDGGSSTYGSDYGSDYGKAAAAPGAQVSGDAVAHERAQRFLVEVQRSLDLWDRSWSTMPLAGLSVYAGERTEELMQWLSREMGQAVQVMDVNAMFPGFEGGAPQDSALCWPLLGALMRTESRKL